MLVVYAVFITFSFITETPKELFSGFYRIITSQSILITDYIAVGGLGATLLNVSAIGIISVISLILSGIKPSGATIMALWITAGFAFFGKNVFNMIPLTVGVWLFAKYKKEPFSNYTLAALLIATISPAVSEVAFLGRFHPALEILMGICFGLVVGFIFPAISSACARVHMGYNLYNMGFAGGLICVVLVPIFRSLGLVTNAANLVSYGNNFVVAVGLYGISAGLILCGLFLGNTKENLESGRKIIHSSGRLVSDFYYEYGNSIYLNMAALTIFATTLALVLGAELNGPTIAGILTVMSFGSFGKHMRNVVPVVAGTLICIYINGWNPAEPNLILAILFSTGLAPIAGQFGWHWGILTGFVHVYIVSHTGYLHSGMNLYANGFAAGFVAMILLPLITAFGKEKVT
jgi:hypothetical protein